MLSCMKNNKHTLAKNLTSAQHSVCILITKLIQFMIQIVIAFMSILEIEFDRIKYSILKAMLMDPEASRSAQGGIHLSLTCESSHV